MNRQPCEHVTTKKELDSNDEVATRVDCVATRVVVEPPPCEHVTTKKEFDWNSDIATPWPRKEFDWNGDVATRVDCVPQRLNSLRNIYPKG